LEAGSAIQQCKLNTYRYPYDAIIFYESAILSSRILKLSFICVKLEAIKRCGAESAPGLRPQSIEAIDDIERIAEAGDD
jgi:hypothetical protein